jgi:hypothetical protein
MRDAVLVWNRNKGRQRFFAKYANLARKNTFQGSVASEDSHTAICELKKTIEANNDKIIMSDENSSRIQK